MKHSSKLLLITLTAMLTLTGFGCKQGDLGAIKELRTQVKLSWWGVFDDTEMVKGIIQDYQALHPNVTIEYRKLRFDEYEQALLEGWAGGQGPDLFFVHNSWVGKYLPWISPMPATLDLPVLVDPSQGVEKGTAVYRKTATLTAQKLKDDFLEAVYQDAYRNGQIVGLPLSVDTLALFYNRDLLNQAKIIAPPKTWTEVKDAVIKLTVQDSDGAILQSGINLGGSNNINRATDIVSLLMLQTGTKMADPSGRAIFNEYLHLEDGQRFSPGGDAIRFYADFGKPAKEVYTWSKALPEAQNLFTSGRLGLFLGYSYQLPFIRAQGQTIDLGLAPVPHLNSDGTDAGRREVNFANYWLATVAKQAPAEKIKWAWDVILFITGKDEVAKYLETARRPPALRALIPQYANDAELGPFVNQLLTAKSWYRGSNPAAAETAMREMIDTVVEGSKPIDDAVSFAIEKINQTF